MQDKTILYNAQVDKFSKRILNVCFPFIVMPVILLVTLLFNLNGDKLINAIGATLIVSVIIMMLVSSYNWTYKQVVSMTTHDDLFEIEIITRNTVQVYKIAKSNIKTMLTWQGGRPRILRLTLFDNDNKIADFYSGGRPKMEYALEEIAYKINNNKTTAANNCLPK